MSVRQNCIPQPETQPRGNVSSYLIGRQSGSAYLGPSPAQAIGLRR